MADMSIVHVGDVLCVVGVDACELAPQPPYESAKMARKATEQRFSSRSLKRITGAASLAPGWRALNRIATVYTHVLSMTVRADGVTKNARFTRAFIIYIYLPLGPQCVPPQQNAISMTGKCRVLRRQ